MLHQVHQHIDSVGGSQRETQVNIWLTYKKEHNMGQAMPSTCLWHNVNMRKYSSKKMNILGPINI